MSKPIVYQNIVDMASSGKTPNLNGISGETINNNFAVKSTTSIVKSINKNKTFKKEKRKELNIAFGLSMAALGATIVLSLISKNAGYVSAGITTVIGLVGLEPYFGFKKAELYEDLATNYVLNNRTK